MDIGGQDCQPTLLPTVSDKDDFDWASIFHGLPCVTDIVFARRVTPGSLKRWPRVFPGPDAF
jgi:hypothetical protein